MDAAAGFLSFPPIILPSPPSSSSVSARAFYACYVVPKLRASASKDAGSKSVASKAEGVEDDEPDEGDLISEEKLAETLQSFLDPVWQHGMDDSPDLNINCVIKYRVDEEKKAALRKAKEASEEGGGHPMAGVPGAISWYLENKSQEGSEAKEIRRAMKNIEGYFSRNFEVDGSRRRQEADTCGRGQDDGRRWRDGQSLSVLADGGAL